MHFLISSIQEIFCTTGNSAAHRIADKLATVPDHDFSERFPPTPPLQDLSAAHLAADMHPFTREIVAAVDYLPWGRLSVHPPPGTTTTERTFCQLVGPEGLIKDDTVRMGVYFQVADTFYPSHWHNAEEIYFVLSGTALWQKDKAPFAAQNPDTLIHHLPNQPHATHTQKEPLLALWGWVGDIGFESYGIE